MTYAYDSVCADFTFTDDLLRTIFERMSICKSFIDIFNHCFNDPHALNHNLFDYFQKNIEL